MDCGVSLLAKDQYMREVRRMVLLTPEQQACYVEQLVRAHREPDNEQLARVAKEARERLAADYQPLVLRCALRYWHAGRGLELMDLVQEGNCGLLYALGTFDSGGPARLCRLVTTCVRGAILTALGRRGQMVYVPLLKAGLTSPKREIFSSCDKTLENARDRYTFWNYDKFERRVLS